MSLWPTLTVLVFFPVAACLVLPFVRGDRAVRVFALVVGLVELLLALPLLSFDLSVAGYQFQEHAAWVPQWGLNYHLGLDGISLLMVLLTVLLLPLCVLCSWSYISRRVKEFHVSLMLMTSACIGVFVALDFVLFYIFWEAMLVPMFLLIAVWGGPERRYASLKFFLYTLAGSTLLLVAMVAFYLAGGTFSIPELSAKSYPFGFQCWTFLAMAFAFAIKVPMFPFHTWLPAAHVEAPTAGSVLLASVLLKMGAYGFLRFCLPLTPAASVVLRPDDDRHLDRLHPLRRVRGARPARHEEADRLLLGRPHGLRDPRHLPLQPARPAGRAHGDAQPRHHHRRPLHAGRLHLRAQPQPRDRREPGAGEIPAGLHGVLRPVRPLLPRVPRDEQLRGRGPGADRGLRGQALGGGGDRPRGHAGRRLHAAPGPEARLGRAHRGRPVERPERRASGSTSPRSRCS